MLTDVRRRIGVIRRLATRISNGKLLSEIARSLVIGKLQTNAWETRCARFNLGPQHGGDTTAQVILNDLGKLLLGVNSADCYTWNASQSLREAKTLQQAQTAAKAFAIS